MLNTSEPVRLPYCFCPVEGKGGYVKTIYVSDLIVLPWGDSRNCSTEH